MRAARKFMHGQCWSEELIRSYDSEEYAYLLLHVPCGERIDELVEVNSGSDAQALLIEAEARAKQRALVKVQRHEEERQLLLSTREKENLLASKRKRGTQTDGQEQEQERALELGGGVMAETYTENGRTVLFLLEVLKCPKAKGRWLPSLILRALRVARHRGLVVAEVHLLVRVKSDAGLDWIRTKAAVVGYEGIGFPNNGTLKAPVKAVGGIEVLTMNDVPLEEGGVPLQQYMVVSVERLEEAIRSQTRHGTGLEHVDWFETKYFDEQLPNHHAWQGLVESEHDESVVRYDGTRGDGATFESLTPKYGEKIIILGMVVPEDRTKSFLPLLPTTEISPSDNSRWLRHYGVESLAKLLGLVMLCRNLWSDTTPRSNSASFGYVLATDASSKHAWGGSKVHRQLSNTIVTPKCWGVTPNTQNPGYWGPAAIRHTMQGYHSVEKSACVRSSFTDDHRPQVCANARRHTCNADIAKKR